MRNKNLFQKIVLIALAIAVLIALVAPAIFAETSPKQEKLLNGLKVLMWRDTKAPKVAVSIRIHAGAAFDPQGKEGVMQLLANNIFPNATSREFFTEDLGGSLDIVTNYDFIQINASSTPESFLSMLETLAAAVSNMAIDKEVTKKLRTELVEKVKVLETDPAYVADRAVARRLFGTFPYGRPQVGTPASVEKIDFADLLDARDRFLTADNATIAISGNFEPVLGFRAVRRYFGAWLKSDKRVPSTFRQPDDPPVARLTATSPKPDVATVRFAMRGAARGDKEIGPAIVFANILQSRLRNSTSSTEVTVSNHAYVLPGMISISIPSKPGADAKAANEAVQKALSDPVTETELQTARSAARTEWMTRDTVSRWLDADTYKIANIETDAKAVDAVSLDDVKAFAEKARKLPLVAVLLTNSPPAA